MVGVLLNLFTNANATVIVAGALFGAGFSVIFGLIAYSLTGGRRDFSSVSQVVATEYEVLCMPEQAGQARQLLSQLPDAGRAMSRGPGGGAPGGSSPYGPPPVAPPPYQPPAQQPHYSPQERSDRAAAGPGQPGPGEIPEQPPVSGPTYGEMMERQRRERAEREAAEREAAQRDSGEGRGGGGSTRAE